MLRNHCKKQMKNKRGENKAPLCFYEFRNLLQFKKTPVQLCRWVIWVEAALFANCFFNWFLLQKHFYNSLWVGVWVEPQERSSLISAYSISSRTFHFVLFLRYFIYFYFILFVIFVFFFFFKWWMKRTNKMGRSLLKAQKLQFTVDWLRISCIFFFEPAPASSRSFLHLMPPGGNVSGQAKTHSGAFNHFNSVPPLGNGPVRGTRQQPPARSIVCVPLQ